MVNYHGKLKMSILLFKKIILSSDKLDYVINYHIKLKMSILILKN